MSDPLQALREAEAEFAVLLAELQGTVAALDEAVAKLRHARAAIDADRLPAIAAAEVWRDFCDRVYREMLATPRY